MELKDFIKQTLLSIVNGVEDANQDKNRFRLATHVNHGNGESGQKVEFDVSIIVTGSSESNVNGGIKVAFANLGGEHKGSDSKQNAHNVKFQVFISEK